MAAMRFDDTFVDQLRSSIGILDLVGGYVRLDKKGNLLGLALVVTVPTEEIE